MDALRAVAEATTGKKMLVFVGLPVVCEGKLYNCAAALADGAVLGFVPKTHLPNYNEFYEARHFVRGQQKLALADLWEESARRSPPIFCSAPRAIPRRASPVRSARTYGSPTRRPPVIRRRVRSSSSISLPATRSSESANNRYTYSRRSRGATCAPMSTAMRAWGSPPRTWSLRATT